MIRTGRVRSLLTDTARAHAMQFDRPRPPVHGSAVGTRMMAAFLAVGVGLFYGLRWAIDAAGFRGLPGTNLAFVLALLLAFALAQRLFVRAPFSGIGLRGFAQWTRLERLYAFQVIPLALVMFAFVFREHLLELIERHGAVGFLIFPVLTGLLWGMAQEFIYRGWLQTELVRCFGPITGVFGANVAFAFGPLHFNYFAGDGGVQWGGLAAVFGIGLIFGIVYRRSGNLWIPAVLHGLWPPNMV
jgi:uncharacterized protein